MYQLLYNVILFDNFVDPRLKVQIVGDVEAAKAVIEDKPGTPPLRFVGDSSAFVMGAMFLASALNRGIHPPEILKMFTNTGGKCFCLGHWLRTWRP